MTLITGIILIIINQKLFLSPQLHRRTSQHRHKCGSQRFPHLCWHVCPPIAYLLITIRDQYGNSELEISVFDFNFQINRVFCGDVDNFTRRSAAELWKIGNSCDFLHTKQWLCDRISNRRCALLENPSRVCRVHLLDGANIACDSQSNRLCNDGDNKSSEEKQRTIASDVTSEMPANRRSAKSA